MLDPQDMVSHFNTSHRPITLKKSAQVVMARENGELQLVDRKLFNFLLQKSYADLMSRRIHQISVQYALDFIRHQSTSRLNESLRRLGTAQIHIDYIDDDNIPHSLCAHYLSFDMSRTKDGVIYFAFDPILIQFAAQPKIFSTLNMSIIRQFRSSYAVKLYEVMAMHEKRFHPVWSISVENFREILGIGDQDYLRFDNLRRRIIEQAVEEVNEIAAFDIHVEYVRGGRGGKVIELKFTALPKTNPGSYPIFEVADPLGRGKKVARDQNTVDLLDGKTDAERGTSFGLLPETREEVSSILKDWGEESDQNAVKEAESEWRSLMQGRKIFEPDKSFIAWISSKMRMKQESELNASLDSSVFSKLLDTSGE